MVTARRHDTCPTCAERLVLLRRRALALSQLIDAWDQEEHLYGGVEAFGWFARSVVVELDRLCLIPDDE